MTLRVLCITPWFPQHREDQMGNFIFDSVEALSQHNCKVFTAVTHSIKSSNLIEALFKNHDFSPSHFLPALEVKNIYYWSIPRNYIRHLSNIFYRKRVKNRLVKFVVKNHIDIIHAHTEIAGLAAMDIGIETNIPWVVSIHGSNRAKGLLKSKAHEQDIKKMLRSANKVLLVGKPIWKEFSEIAGSDRNFQILFNGVRLKKAKKEISIFSKDIIRFVSVSNLHKEKGVDITLSALSKLKNNGFDCWQYDVIGDGYQREELESLVSQFGLQNHVKFYGAMNHDEVLENLTKADVFVLPSYREAFGVAYLEAMASGLLTVAVDGQGASSFITHNESGLLVEPCNSESLFECLGRVFNEQEFLREVAKKGQNQVYRDFSWSNHAKRLMQIYETLSVG